MIRRAVSWPLAIVVAGCITIAIVAGSAAALLRPPAITEQEALQVLDRIERGIAAGQGRPDPASFCPAFASNQTMCTWSLEIAGTVLPDGPATPLDLRSLPDGTVVIEVEGRLTDGNEYSGFIQIVRRDDAGPVAADPVYWLTREFTEDSTAKPETDD